MIGLSVRKNARRLGAWRLGSILRHDPQPAGRLFRYRPSPQDMKLVVTVLMVLPQLLCCQELLLEASPRQQNKMERRMESIL
jgi:hypothetical protein